MVEKRLTKSELIAEIRKGRDQLDMALARFSENQKTKARLENGWSIKDLMAHISAGERVGFDIVQPARDREPLKAYVPKIFESIDNFNSKTYEKNKDKPLCEIDAEFWAAFKDFVALIETLDESLIASNLAFEGAEEISVQFMISTNTHLHYREHAGALEAL